MKIITIILFCVLLTPMTQLSYYQTQDQTITKRQSILKNNDLKEQDQKIMMSQFKKMVDILFKKKDKSIKTPFQSPFIDSVESQQERIQKFLSQLNNIDCLRRQKDYNTYPFNMLCDDQLMIHSFVLLKDLKASDVDVIKYINDNIYNPLALKNDISFRMQNIFSNLLDISKQDNVFNKTKTFTNFYILQENMRQKLQTIHELSPDIIKNESQINETIRQILTNFHIYWNYMRYKKQFSQLKSDTQDIMEEIIQSLLIKSSLQTYSNKILIQKFLEAYYKFLKANKLIEIVQNQGNKLIANQIIGRYKNIVQLLINKKLSHVQIVKELSILINLQQAYNTLSYKIGIKENQIIDNQEGDLLSPITQFLNQTLPSLYEQKDEESIITLKQFTATLLLKFKHMTFIIFKVHGIAQYTNYLNNDYTIQDKGIMIYYELQDIMAMIPNDCLNQLNLKDCAIHRSMLAVRYIVQKYMLKRSTFGWNILDQISSTIKNIFQNDFKKKYWLDFNFFKEQFYIQLFKSFHELKNIYNIKNMTAIDELQEKLGDFFEQMKIKLKFDNVQYGMIDMLDKQLYDQILKIKVKYNGDAPIEKNPMIIQYISSLLTQYVNKFTDQQEEYTTSNFMTIIEQLKQIILQWSVGEHSPSSEEVQIVDGKDDIMEENEEVNTHEFNKGEQYGKHLSQPFEEGLKNSSLINNQADNSQSKNANQDQQKQKYIILELNTKNSNDTPDEIKTMSQINSNTLTKLQQTLIQNSQEKMNNENNNNSVSILESTNQQNNNAEIEKLNIIEKKENNDQQNYSDNDDDKK